MKHRGIPGLSIAIASHGKIVFSQAFGFANLESRVPATPATLFPSASTLKALTAVAVLELVRDGLLSLASPIQKYCKDYPEKPWTVTIGDLLAHTGGIRASSGDEVFNQEHYRNVSDAVRAFADDSLVAEPGAQFVYSNAGYTLLACAIEGVTGRSYDERLRDHILAPAQMAHTRRDDVFTIIENRATGYMIRTKQNTTEWAGLWRPRHLLATVIDEPFNADRVDHSLYPGAGNYLTTPLDLVNFGLSVQGRLLNEKLRSRMFEDQRLRRGELTGFGLGWTVSPWKGHFAPRTVGSVWTGSSALLLLPKNGFAIAISTNLGFEQPYPLLEEILTLLGVVVSTR